ncbi:unnamed protein product [Lactuca saligna]|uniref:Leucine-rich repeat-containing N-terminal plant-type domain-containing protein n=1 Tax=Lactuca saligna TaxID=75948 RepID=A0AA36DYU8_LACSI|nr:unnamed protein product [Lactuca saligna]
MNSSASIPCTSWFGGVCNADGSIQKLNLTSSRLRGMKPLNKWGLGPASPGVGSKGQYPWERGLRIESTTQILEYENVIHNSQDFQVFYPSFLTRENKFSGEIPPEIGSMITLEFLDISSNNISRSILPSVLGALTSLFVLSLYQNQLSGAIPIELGNLKSLTFLEVSMNQLSGTIPSSLANLSNLQHLYLDENNLSGTIPIELGNLKSLTFLRVSKNQVSGNIPSSLANLSNQYRLNLAHNKLSLVPFLLILGN